ncbi:MAG TPA: hypothetical protein VNK89_05070 [Thermoflexus sp.]|nr:hypothetical protein [Thermoflexus sp.]
MRRWIQRTLQLWGGFLVTLLLLGWPVAVAFLFPPSGWRLAQPWYYGGDFSQYLSAMRQGMGGAWRIINRFSPEPHAPVLQYPFYVALGHIARFLHAPPEALYGAASILGLAVLWGSLHRLFAAFLPPSKLRTIAFAMLFSNGPVWILPLMFPKTTWGSIALDAATRIEYDTFLALMAPPHLSLTLAALLNAVLDLSELPVAIRAGVTARIALVLVVLAALNPFSLPTLMALVFLRTILGIRERRWAAKAGIVEAAVLTLLAVPLTIYYIRTFHHDPFWGMTYGRQNLQPAYPLPLVIAVYGATGLLGMVGAIRAWRLPSGPDGFRKRYLALAAGGLLALAYIPLPYARRFTYGLGPILAVLAAPIVGELLAHPALERWRASPGLRVGMYTGAGILLYSQNAFLYAIYALSFLGAGPFPRAVFQPAAAFEAAAWLRQQGPQVVVLACEEDGNFLAGWIEGRVVLGHAGATFDVARKREEVAAFWRGDLPKPEQEALLRRYGVTHLYYREDHPCDQKRPEGTPAFAHPPVWIFAVEERR